MWRGRHVSFPLMLAVLFCCWDANVCPSAALKPKDLEFLGQLKTMFVEALTEHPELELPGMNFPETATVEEKANALAVHVSNLAGHALDAWFAENGELEDIRQALQVKDRKSRRERLLAAIKKFFQNLHKFIKAKKSCKEVKAAGITPEARLGHSPIPLFGFPIFNTEYKMTVLERRLPLNKFNRHKVGIKVGLSDYIVQGSVKKVLEFLDCFEDYTVSAQTLFADGHWSSEARDGVEPRPLYLQIQGVMQADSIAGVIVREALERVIRQVDLKLKKKGTLLALVEEALRGEMGATEYLKSKGTAAALRNLRAYARMQGSDFLELVKDVAEAPTFQAKLNALHKHLGRVEGGPDDWSQPWVVKDQHRITLTFTAYPHPDYNNRSTKRMPGSVATLRDVAKAVREIKWDW